MTISAPRTVRTGRRLRRRHRRLAASRARRSTWPTGGFAAERVRIPTPPPSTPEAVATVVDEIVERFGRRRRRRADRRHLPRGDPARRGADGRQRRPGLDRHRRRRRCSPHELGRPVHVRQRRGRRRRRRGALRRGQGRQRRSGPGDHPGHRDRHRPHRSTACWCPTPSWGTSRSTATTPRPGRPTASASAENLSLGGVGQAAAAVLPPPRGPALARPDRRRRRGEQEGRPVPAAARRCAPRSCRPRCATTAGIIGAALRGRRAGLSRPGRACDRR